MAERFERDQAALVRYGDRGGREGTVGDCFLQNGKGSGKDFVLMIEGG
jgi:hypothetical protein